MKKCAYSRYRRYPYSRERALESSRRNGGSPVAVAGVIGAAVGAEGRPQARLLREPARGTRPALHGLRFTDL